jgi:hypothetical protein
MAMPVTTLKELCRQHAPPVFEFLKVDVEGAEQEVLLNGDWRSFRPKVVVVEALAPYTLAPAWPAWEPFLAKHGYRYVWFDSLNRYYLAEEASELARCFETALEQAAGADAITEATERVFGPEGRLPGKGLKLPPVPSLREVYAALLDSDEFRAACGRISASYAW